MTLNIKNKKGCKCQKCGKIFKVDFLVSDDLWEKIKPKNKHIGAGLLCGSCIAKKIENFNNYAAYKIIKL